MDPDTLDPRAALAAWRLEHAVAHKIEAGHINRTWRIEHPGGRALLQWLNPIFSPQLHLDIEDITAQLEARGLCTPRLLRTRDDALYYRDVDGAVWRLFTFIEGETLLAADSPARCAQAGGLLGAFHEALWDLDHEFHFTRLGVHDTAAHLRALSRALDLHQQHPRYSRVEPLAQEILETAARLDLAPDLPRRLVHGDPKISNFLFSPTGEARCLVDLDTLARMPIAVELGDAFRSWGNPRGEEEEAAFELPFFEAGLASYAAAVGALPSADEREAIPACVELISVELAVRFCADALNERYFNWDRRRFASASEHNEQRARSQLGLARSVRAQLGALEASVRAAWR